MSDKPILKLFTELGRESTDRIVISYYNDTTEWTSKQVPVVLADALAKSLTDQGMNVYNSVNPVSFLGSAGRGKIADVTALSALFADLDYKDSGLNGEESARKVIESLSAVLNCQPVAIVHSGHGLQPYWAVEDGGISDINRNYVAGILKRFGYLVARFAEIEGGSVDSVYDLTRVLRAPGTVNFKDRANPAPTEVEFFEWSHPLNLQEIDEVLVYYGFLNENITVDHFEVLSHPEEWQPAEVDCQWSLNLANGIARGNPKERHPWLLGEATKIEVAARNGCITEATYGQLVILLDAKFTDILSKGSQPRKQAPGEVNTALKWARARVSTFTDVKMADNLNYHTHKAALYAVPDLPKESSATVSDFSQPSPTATNTTGNLALAPELAPVTLGDMNFRFTDSANAERLANAAEGRFIFVPGLGWYVWDGGRYVRDEANKIIRLAIETARSYAEEDASKAAIEWGQKSLGAGSLAATVRLTETEPTMVTLATNLDNKPLELCTPNGIAVLGSDGGLREADPTVDMHTRQTRFTPAPGPMPLFMKFLNTILEEQERIDYVQELFGVALIGELRWHILPVFSGAGANGKSTLLDIVGACIGDYSAVMPENFLLDGGRLEHSTEIFRLRGVRLAIASETRPDGKFNESRVKMLTGEPVLSARGMRQDFVDFNATHTLFLALNHPPAVKSGGDGFWRRVRKLDFRFQVPKAERDPQLAQKILATEGPQILHWLMEGANRVMEKGIKEPLDVELATNAYRDEEDHVNTFLIDCTAIDPYHPGFTTLEIYSTYVAWCKKNGNEPLSSIALMRDLRSRMPLVPVKIKGQRGWKGLMVYVDRDGSV